MASGETYEKFVEKFKPKLTTDDCYTPPIVYVAIALWVAKEYSVDPMSFCRPFYPGGDFESFDYSEKIVVDNPPFSMVNKIVKWYVDRNIRFFLFSPTLTTLVGSSELCTALAVGADITYENGARIKTSFLTNLEPFEIRMRTPPTLFDTIKNADELNRKEKVKALSKIVYPPNIITSAMAYSFANVGIDLIIKRAECVRIRQLDCMKPIKKTIFGDGLLVSDDTQAEIEKAEIEKAEREKAEREKAERFFLSEREKEIVKQLSRK